MKALLVDDRQLVGDSPKDVLRGLDAELEPDEAGTCAEAFKRAATLERATARSYGLVFFDLNMLGLNGLDIA